MNLTMRWRASSPLIFLMACTMAHAFNDFSRSDFNDSQAFHVGFLGKGGGVPYYLVGGSGGNPGTWGKMGVRGSGPGGPDVIGFEYVTYDDWTFDPATEGSVTKIDTEGDARNYTFQNGFEQGAKLVFIINQAGKYYAEGGDYGGGSPWFHGGFRSINLNNFVSINPLTGRIDGNGGTPDANVGLMTFGFGMDYTYTSDSEVFTGIDNVHYHVNAVPEPAPLLIASLGVTVLLIKRRK